MANTTHKENTGLRCIRVPLTLKRIYDRCTEEGECQLWKGPTSSRGGFPCAYVDGEKRSLRSYVYTVILGNEMPAGCATSVSCRNRLCLAKDHLFSRRLSAIRKESHIAVRADPVAYERMRTGAHAAGHAKLDMERAQAIRNDDRPTKEIAADHGVSAWTISAIKRKATYKPPMIATSVFNLASTL